MHITTIQRFIEKNLPTINRIIHIENIFSLSCLSKTYGIDLINFSLEHLNLIFQRFVLFHLAFEKAPRHGHLLCNASRGQNVHILELVLAVLKVLQLDQALVHQRIQAVVQPTQAHAKPLGQVALADIGALLQDAHDPEGGVFLDLGLAAGHVVGLGTLPPCRVAIGMRGGVKLAVVPSNVRT